MTEIILSFFAVIGITLLLLHFCDYLFYRKFHPNLTLFVDLRSKCEEEAIEILELLSTVRSKKSGQAAIGEIVILIKRHQNLDDKVLYHYLNVFQLPGKVYFDDQPHWTESVK